MKLTILGHCGPYPDIGGACSGYLISSASGRTQVLLDCGTGVLARLQGQLPPDRLDAVILSHLHFDHMSDLLPMQYALQFHPRMEPLPVLLPDSPEAVRTLVRCPQMALKPMEDVQIGEIRFRFFRVRHPVETYAVRAEADGACLVYTGDSNSCAGLESFARGADLLLADAGLLEADWQETSPHMSARLCGLLAQSAGASRLLLTHRNPRYRPEQLAEEAQCFMPDAEFCREGECYLIEHAHPAG